MPQNSDPAKKQKRSPRRQRISAAESNPPLRPTRRGGTRPGAGRKPGWGECLSKTLQVCVTPSQEEIFRRLGGPKWLRAVLESQKEGEKNKLFQIALEEHLAQASKK